MKYYRQDKIEYASKCSLGAARIEKEDGCWRRYIRCADYDDA